MCGEKLLLHVRCCLLPGSPPRVRGKVVRVCMATGLRGITPACAGKSFSKCSRMSSSRDHPRVCGEKPGTFDIVTSGQGSPPRVRGKACCVSKAGLSVGITPACAGKRLMTVLTLDSQWDHPRVCGEKMLHFSGRIPSSGSPPRVRGKAVWPVLLPLPLGITPACAGKSSKSSGRR